MKKYIIAVISMVLMSLSARAQETELEYILSINTMSGETIDYLFSAKPVATFEGEDMLITLAGEEAVAAYPMADIKNITFSSKESGVDETQALQRNIVVRITKDSVAISGMEPESEMRIFSLAGELITVKRAGADGSVDYGTSGLVPGVYVVSIPGKTFKFMK